MNRFSFVLFVVLLGLLSAACCTAEVLNCLTPGQPFSNEFGQASDNVYDVSSAAANTLLGPRSVAVDQYSGKIYIADSRNNRVLRYDSSTYTSPQPMAEAVFGQTDFTSNAAPSPPSAASLYHPTGVFVDTAGTLWVADALNNRVLYFTYASTASSGTPATGVLGQPDFTSTATGTGAGEFDTPWAVLVDPSGNVFVADRENQRVVRFNGPVTTGASSSGVLGTTTNCNNSNAATLLRPVGLARDALGNLYVSEGGNNRVTVFSSATALSSGGSAFTELGQYGFGSSNISSPFLTNASSLDSPRGISVDNATLYVCDAGSNRVVSYTDASADSPNGASHDLILGQNNNYGHYVNEGKLDASYSDPNASTLFQPEGVFVDGYHASLWVADFRNNRVTRYGCTLSMTVSASFGFTNSVSVSLSGISKTGSNDVTPSGVSKTGSNDVTPSGVSKTGSNDVTPSGVSKTGSAGVTPSGVSKTVSGKVTSSGISKTGSADVNPSSTASAAVSASATSVVPKSFCVPCLAKNKCNSEKTFNEKCIDVLHGNPVAPPNSNGNQVCCNDATGYQSYSFEFTVGEGCTTTDDKRKLRDLCDVLGGVQTCAPKVKHDGRKVVGRSIITCSSS